jgi:hypothetical protein
MAHRSFIRLLLRGLRSAEGRRFHRSAVAPTHAPILRDI